MSEHIPSSPSPRRPPDGLESDVEQWVREHLIRREQGDMILAWYGLGAGGETPRSLRWLHGASLITVAGAVLAGIGGLLIVGANWGALPQAARLGLLLAGVLACYGAGYWLAFERAAYPAVGRALVFLGSLLWLAGIFLVGQMFHLGGGNDPEYATGLFYGFAGLLPMAYILRSPLHLALALSVGSAAVCLRTASVYFSDGFGLFVWTGLAAGLLIYVAGLYQRRMEAEETLAPTYAKFGIALTSLGLYVLTVLNPASELLSSGSGPAYPWPLYGAVVAMSAVAAVGYAATARRRDPTAPCEALACVLLAVAVAIGAAWSVRGDAAMGHVVTIAANILLLALEMGVLALGWARAQPGLISWGLTLFFIHLTTRYFDLFATMWHTGAAFAGAGLFLLLVGFALERLRRRLLQTLPAGRPSEEIT